MFPDARRRVEETYDDAANYLVEEIIDGPGIFWLQATNRVTGYSHLVGVVTGSTSPSEQEPVQFITLAPVIEQNSNLSPALLPDLYSVLGDVKGIAISDLGSVPQAMLFYKEPQLGIIVQLLPCHKVLLDQEIAQIILYDSTFLEDKGWLSGGILQWWGFGRCYSIS